VGIGRFITHTMFGKGAADYGDVPVPGSAEFDFPAGRIHLTYEEAAKSKVTALDDSAKVQVNFAAPPQLEVSVTSASGGTPLAIEPPGFTSTSTKKDQSRDDIGSVEIAAPGTYLVTAGPALPDAVEPKILIGT
jgi:hypothetical protein